MGNRQYENSQGSHDGKEATKAGGGLPKTDCYLVSSVYSFALGRSARVVALFLSSSHEDQGPTCNSWLTGTAVQCKGPRRHSGSAVPPTWYSGASRAVCCQAQGTMQWVPIGCMPSTCPKHYFVIFLPTAFLCVF